MNALLEVDDVAKSFPGVRALDGVTFRLDAGEICTLAGENGAGKSTLLAILGGALTPDRGSITIDGVRRAEFSPRRALADGVVIAHQEPAIVPQLTVAQNVFIGRPRAERKNARRVVDGVLADMERMGFPTTAGTPAATLSPAERQSLAIARSFAFGARIIALDEPTTSMLEQNATQVLERVREIVRERNVGVLFVSHKMPEVMQVSDSVVVLRDGRTAFRSAIVDTDDDEIVRKMVGRELLAFTREHPVAPDAPVHFEATGVRHPRHPEPLDIAVRAGEVVGIAGLVGSGRTEFLRAIIRADPGTTGRIMIGGHDRRVTDPHSSRAAGIAFVPEERKRQGLVLQIPAYANIAMTADRQFSALGPFVSKKRQVAVATEQTDGMSLRPGDVRLNARQFSGGNQQKLVIAKWTWRGSTVYLFDEPTKGVDVGGKVEIYRLIDRLASQGNAILVVSSDLPEVISLSDRVLVMRGGRFVGSFEGSDINEQTLVASAMGVAKGQQ
ncbi:sugar ABC transporter ATP-binding protein [uncultured Microbacterium sp.]|uniref:sugar ABC transporter ATP-binding protein n=1 Tax=uncultured Microbacterium sp. TaxID=191216 RepID=UPI0025DDFAF3|nr:sugar ABC transporter ATP-binding protein [uncultured Microbacterium sp.]